MAVKAICHSSVPDAGWVWRKVATDKPMAFYEVEVAFLKMDVQKERRGHKTKGKVNEGEQKTWEDPTGGDRTI